MYYIMDIEKELSNIKHFCQVYSPITHSRNEWELMNIQLISLEKSVKIIKDFLIQNKKLRDDSLKN